MNRTKIGTGGVDYVEFRNVTSVPLNRYEFGRVYDLCNIPNYLNRKLLNRSVATSFFNCLYCDLGLNGVPLLHFCNTLSCSTTPWIVSYSDYLPRWNPRSKFGMKLLAGKHCKKVIAISKFAYDHQSHFLEAYPSYKAEIQSKMCIIHPSQKTLINDYSKKRLDNDFITFALVGSDFFRKGGKEILLAFKRLIDEGYPVKLNVVSSLDYGDYASGATVDDQNDARVLIRSLGDRINHHETLPNDEVLKILIGSHVSLLPTYDDIYGYSVLEAQAAGCPAISTDVCALPEINNTTIGWLIQLPKDRFGIAHRHDEQQRRNISSILEEQLYRIIRDICLNRDTIQLKGVQSLERIRKEHRPEDRTQSLEEIYDAALGSVSPLSGT